MGGVDERLKVGGEERILERYPSEREVENRERER